MNLLLLFSALLSALTGAVSGVRTADAPRSVCAGAVAVQVAAVAVRVTVSRPGQPLPGIDAVRAGASFAPVVPQRTALYASRRRE